MRNIVIAFSLLLVANICTGDTIVLKDGRQLQGKVIARSRGKIAIKTDRGELVMFKDDEVAEIVTGDKIAPPRSAAKREDRGGAAQAQGGTGPRGSVRLWSELAGLDGRKAPKCVRVSEPARAGDVAFVKTADLPTWARGADITGLCITDRGRTGKWVHQPQGAVDFGRLGTRQDGNPRDERDALNALVAAGFTEISFPEGKYDAYLNYTVSKPLKLVGAGSDKTVFVGDGAVAHTGFRLESSLTLEGLRFQQQVRLVWINPSWKTSLGTLKLDMTDVVYHVEDKVVGKNQAAICSIPTEPVAGSPFRLEMEDCRFRVAPEMDHINSRCGLLGSIHRCTFEGGKRGIFNIPTTNKRGAIGPANVVSPDFRVTDCIFGTFTYTGGADSYHMQVTGEKWVISGCTFGAMSGSGKTSSGHLYSNLHDSRIVDCTFKNGGSFHLYFKGAQRIGPSDRPVDGNGWGNLISGCTFEGSGPVLQQGQIYMNIKEQRFVDCDFRDYSTYAINANQKCADSDNLLVENCRFSSQHSSSAIRLCLGGRNIRIQNCTFSGITGAHREARRGIVVFDPYPGQHCYTFEDVLVENCTFKNNSSSAVYFYGAGRCKYDVNRFRFVRNTVRQPAGGGFVAGIGRGPTIRDLVLEDNYIDVHGDGAWRMPAGCVARSTGNTWVERPGKRPPTPEARGTRSSASRSRRRR